MFFKQQIKEETTKLTLNEAIAIEPGKSIDINYEQPGKHSILLDVSKLRLGDEIQLTIKLNIAPGGQPLTFIKHELQYSDTPVWDIQLPYCAGYSLTFNQTVGRPTMIAIAAWSS